MPADGSPMDFMPEAGDGCQTTSTAEQVQEKVAEGRERATKKELRDDQEEGERRHHPRRQSIRDARRGSRQGIEGKGLHSPSRLDPRASRCGHSRLGGLRRHRRRGNRVHPGRGNSGRILGHGPPTSMRRSEDIQGGPPPEDDEGGIVRRSRNDVTGRSRRVGLPQISRTATATETSTVETRRAHAIAPVGGQESVHRYSRTLLSGSRHSSGFLKAQVGRSRRRRQPTVDVSSVEPPGARVRRGRWSPTDTEAEAAEAEEETEARATEKGERPNGDFETVRAAGRRKLRDLPSVLTRHAASFPVCSSSDEGRERSDSRHASQ